MAQRDVQAVGEECDEDVRLDPSLELVEDRADAQIAFEGLECFLDRHQLQVVLPEFRRIGLGQVRTQ
jgi:hypothetical protein